MQRGNTVPVASMIQKLCHTTNKIIFFYSQKEEKKNCFLIQTGVIFCFSALLLQNQKYSSFCLNKNTFLQLQKLDLKEEKQHQQAAQTQAILWEQYSHPSDKQEGSLTLSSCGCSSAGQDFLPHASPESGCFGGCVLCSSAALRK